MSLMLLAVPLAWAVGRAALQPDQPAGDLPAVRTGVDPNTAPSWELSALPGIGEATAGKIVAFRAANADWAPVFRCPQDLEPVPDIGSKTIQRIARHLRFPD